MWTLSCKNVALGRFQPLRPEEPPRVLPSPKTRVTLVGKSDGLSTTCRISAFAFVCTHTTHTHTHTSDQKNSYDAKTEAVSWEKPDELKTAEELEHEQGEWTWVPSPHIVWQGARIAKKLPNGDVLCKTLAGALLLLLLMSIRKSTHACVHD